MIIQKVTFASALSDEAVRMTMVERAPQFRAQPGLVQKFYVKDLASGEYSGIYLWDSMESLQKFRTTELARTIPQAYRVQGAPKVETLELIMSLRPDVGP